MFGNTVAVRVAVGFVILSSLRTGSECQQVNPQVLNMLAEHGDRLTDVERLYQNISAVINVLKNNMDILQKENTDLKQQIQKLTQGYEQCGCGSTMSQTFTSTPANKTTLGTNLTTGLNTNSPSSKATTSLLSTTTPSPGAATEKSTTSMVPTRTTAPPQTTTLTTTVPTKTTTPPTTTTPKTIVHTTTTTTQAPVYDSCSQALTSGQQSIVTKLLINRLGRVIDAVCESVEGREWLVIQRRDRGDVSFDRGWAAYRDGFGQVNATGDFWLGNEVVYKLTKAAADSRLRIELEDWAGQTVYAEYRNFYLEAERYGYRLHVGDYSGNAGDSFNYPDSYQLQHNQMAFSTTDRDNDNSFMNCARELGGGWWFNSCYSSNLNGAYLKQAYGHRSMGEMYGEPTLEGTGIEWYPFKRRQYSMKRTEMKISINSPTVLVG